MGCKHLINAFFLFFIQHRQVNNAFFLFFIQHRQVPWISNRFTELCDTVVARSASVADALSAKAHSRVIGRMQRAENLEDVKLNLERHLISSSSSEESSRKGLSQSPSLPCLSTLRRHQECLSSPALASAYCISLLST